MCAQVRVRDHPAARAQALPQQVAGEGLPLYGHLSARGQHVGVAALLWVWQVHVTPGSLLAEHMCAASLEGCVNTDPGLAQWIHACSQGGDRWPGIRPSNISTCIYLHISDAAPSTSLC